MTLVRDETISAQNNTPHPHPNSHVHICEDYLTSCLQGHQLVTLYKTIKRKDINYLLFLLQDVVATSQDTFSLGRSLSQGRLLNFNPTMWHTNTELVRPCYINPINVFLPFSVICTHNFLFLFFVSYACSLHEAYKIPPCLLKNL